MKDFYYTIFSFLEQGLSPKQIRLKLNMSYQALNYYLRRLKKDGYIKKVGFGTWETIGKITKKTSRYAKRDIRGHAFRFQIKFPLRKSWKQTQAYFIRKLEKKNIKHKIINRTNLSFKLKSHTLWICKNGSIHIIFRRGYSTFASKAKETYNEARYNALSLLKALEVILSQDFSNKGVYQFQCKKHHYAFVSSPVAHFYREQGKKFIEFRDKNNELWALIDESFDPGEFETQHPKTAIKDSDNLRKFFNSHKDMPFTAYDFHSLANSVKTLADFNQQYAENIKLHLETLQEMKDTLKEIRKNGK